MIQNSLASICEQKNRELFGRIILLTWDEQPLEIINGIITQGSINVDGKSAIRRTCSLTMINEHTNYNTYHWTLKTKFKLEIGLKNQENDQIVWFKQGLFILTSFNTAHTSNNFSITLQGKDKMCLLNGEVGGVLASSVDFGQIDEETSDGIWTTRKLPIVEIIKNMLHTYAKESYYNIIINDLDTYGVELLEYRYEIPMYFYKKLGDTIYTNVLLENDSAIYSYKLNNIIYQNVKLSEIPYSHLEQLVENLTGTITPEPIYTNYGTEKEQAWIFTKINYGDTAGYRTTDIIYAGDLIANIGESLTSILDKIKNMLVEFEYFYDLDGRFIFQKKQSFISTLWSPLNSDQYNNNYITESLALSSATTYSFNDLSLISAFNNTPNINNIKNDYSVWGERLGISGIKIPIHMRYAIDTKPIKYYSITVEDNEVVEYNKKYNTDLKGQEGKLYSVSQGLDWREIIYRMALDNYKYSHLDDFELKVQKANPIEYSTGITGYEQYYTDLLSFWKELYMSDDDFVEQKQKIEELKGQQEDKQAELGELYDSLSAYNSIIEHSTNPLEMIEAAKKEIKSLNEKIQLKENELKIIESNLNTALQNYDQYYHNSEDQYYGWNKNIFEQPENLNFWFDFLDLHGELEAFSVKSIGSRPKAINDNNVKSIYYRETPKVMFVQEISQEQQITGYKYIQIPGIENMFSISAQGKSAKEKIDELLYEHGYCSESVSITSVPLYFLEPNTRIYIQDIENNISGDYIISQMTIPLTYNGTMSITATKAVENIL